MVPKWNICPFSWSFCWLLLSFDLPFIQLLANKPDEWRWSLRRIANSMVKRNISCSNSSNSLRARSVIDFRVSGTMPGGFIPSLLFFFTFLLAYRLGMHCISLLFFSSLIMSGWWRWLLLLLFSLVCFVHRVLPYCLCVCPQLSFRMNEWMNRSRLSAHALQQLAKPCSSFCVRNLHDNWENVPWKQENVGTFCCGQLVFL